MEKPQKKDKCTSIYNAKQARIQKEIEKKASLITSKTSSISAEQAQNAEETIQKIINSFSSSIISQEIWIFLSIPSFQISIESRDNPSLSTSPFIISDGSNVLHVSDSAKLLKIQPTMPEFQAVSLCSHLTILPPSHEKYKTECLKIKSILKPYDPQYEETGLDQFALCVSQVLKRRCMDTDAGREALAHEIRRKIYNETLLESSAGIACNKELAKISCDLAVGQFYLRPESVNTFMRSLKIEENVLFSKNECKLLELLDIKTCGEVLNKKLELFIGLNEVVFKKYLKAAMGAGETSHCHRKEKKSYSATANFEPNDCEEILEVKLRELADILEIELKKNRVKGRGIEIILKNCMFENRVRREESKKFFTNGKELFELAVILLKMFYPVEPVRSLVLKIWKLKEIGEKVVKVDQRKEKKETEFERMFVKHSVVPSKGTCFAGIGFSSYQLGDCKEWVFGKESETESRVKRCRDSE